MKQDIMNQKNQMSQLTESAKVELWLSSGRRYKPFDSNEGEVDSNVKETIDPKEANIAPDDCAKEVKKCMTCQTERK